MFCKDLVLCIDMLSLWVCSGLFLIVIFFNVDLGIFVDDGWNVFIDDWYGREFVWSW